MSKVIVTDRDGSSRAIRAVPGCSVMEIIRNAGLDDLMALCGGCCSCATCHIYVDPSGAHALPPMSQDEDDLLNSSDHRRGTSRLACQIPFIDALDGMRISIAPED